MLRITELKGNLIMKLSITLADADIKAALIAHAKSSLSIDLADETVSVNLTAGRKDKGYSAEIIIGSDDTVVEAPVAKTTAVKPAIEEAIEPVVEAEPEVELPMPTPETVGHETEAKSSLFD
jgi:ribosomal protein S5